MNLSGEAVRAVVDYYKIPIEDVIIVYDDLSLELGKIRFRQMVLMVDTMVSNL